MGVKFTPLKKGYYKLDFWIWYNPKEYSFYYE